MPTIRWYHNGIELAPKPRYTITVNQETGDSNVEITQITQEDTGAYQVIAENPSGSATSTCIITLKGKRWWSILRSSICSIFIYVQHKYAVTKCQNASTGGVNR